MPGEKESVAHRSLVPATVALFAAFVLALAQLAGPGVPASEAQSVMDGGTGSIEADPQPGPLYHAGPQILADAPLGTVINSRDVTMPAPMVRC